MLDLYMVLGALTLLYILIMVPEGGVGHNAAGAFETVMEIKERFRQHPMNDWARHYKDSMKTLGKAAFNRFKMLGVRPVKRSKESASKGFDKLTELLRMTKVRPHGRVLSLCCGRGGWEQVVAPRPEVEKITSVTFGPGASHQGHEIFTPKYFAGREKVDLIYGDARRIGKTPHETLLFDGGEENSDSVKEADKFVGWFVGFVT